MFSLGCRIPKKIDFLTNKKVVRVLCGSQFSMALTKDGHVYTWYAMLFQTLLLFVVVVVVVYYCPLVFVGVKATTSGLVMVMIAIRESPSE